MGEEVMEFIQALVILILAIGFNGGISGGLNGEILPPGATLIPSGQYSRPRKFLAERTNIRRIQRMKMERLS